jgi:uncharacterized protein YecT (DUF1311 family)
MKNIVLLILFSFIGFSAIAQSQSQLNLDADAAYKTADIELNNVYRQILEKYRNDAKFIDKLKNAQRIWISYRDAEVDLRYPPHQDFGSVYPMCVSMFLKEITEDRVGSLKLWLNGLEEGEVCQGSIK